MTGDLRSMFCGESDCSESGGNPCSSTLVSAIHPSPCFNHALSICFDILLLLVLLHNMIQKTPSKKSNIPISCFQRFSPLQISSAIVSGCLGLAYLGLAIWILEEKLRKTQTALPLHWWTLELFQGVTWLSVGLMGSLQGKHFRKAPLRLLSILVVLFSGILCFLSFFIAIVNKEASVKVALDVVSFPV